MTIDDICKMTTRVSTLNALHACREGHAWNNAKQWRNAWHVAMQDRNITVVALAWLNDKARKEGGHKDVSRPG
jgi:hypothetical protein